MRLFLNKIGNCVLIVAIITIEGLFTLTCKSETPDVNSSAADLFEVSIGTEKIINIRLGADSEQWERPAFNIRTMRTMDIELEGAALSNAQVRLNVSQRAKARFARASDEAKPDTFSTEATWTFAPNDYLYIMITSGDNSNVNYYRVRVVSKDADVRLAALRINSALAVLGLPGKTAAEAVQGSITVKTLSNTGTVTGAPIIAVKRGATAQAAFAVGSSPTEEQFSTVVPAALSTNNVLWVKVTAGQALYYYQVIITIRYDAGFGFGESDTEWNDDAYNANYRRFPNAPINGILEYPWGSGTDNYFDTNAPPSYWNGKGHNHKYPDLFHFANGNAVKNIADWENRRKEIFNILQYYMHGRMPSIEPDVLEIEWADTGNTCSISLTHLASGRTAAINVTHTPPSGAVKDAKDRILCFGVGGAPGGSRPGWGTGNFNTAWGGSEGDRSGTCAALYGLNVSAKDTPSVNMEYAWAMSVILTVLEEGGLNGYYNPAKVGIYGFSRYGKAALCISAFAQGRSGSQVGITFVGSSGSGGAAIDRWIAPMAYKDFAEDPLPVDGVGARARADLKGTKWFYNKIEDDHNAATAIRAVRGWAANTPGIPAGSHIYGEYDPGIAGSFTRTMMGEGDWNQIQPLAQSRGETSGWFNARFSDLQDLHTGLALDRDNQAGVLCTMPFDAHFIAALVAPRIIYYQDGYDCLRTNPESQWAAWLMCDEIYQMYAEELGDPLIIWRNAVKMYNIGHMHYDYQNQDEYDLVEALYSGRQPNEKFRTPQFPVDDPRYRWDFNRVDWGRPNHPTIAERVRLMRESPYKVKPLSLKGLLDTPERL
ncbi:MAG: hypothetical protein LBB72_07860 [Spirochaetaceae bacterium]|jgi:hypothetical protein|nr:hypothetical protein [Spirochaetaceae bacterium]